MPKKDLELVGGEYAPVATRITLFYERYTEGRIVTELVSRSEREVTFRALVYRTPSEREPAATGWASEIQGDGDINTVACLENTETSAIGRALANLGFTASSRRPSAEEMEKAARARVRLSIVRAPVGDSLSAAVDALDLLLEAERAGLERGRVRRLRARLVSAAARTRDVERIERALRRWLVERDLRR